MAILVLLELKSILVGVQVQPDFGLDAILVLMLLLKLLDTIVLLIMARLEGDVAVADIEQSYLYSKKGKMLFSTF